MSKDLDFILRNNPDIAALNPELLKKKKQPNKQKAKRPDTELEAKFMAHWKLLTNDEPLLRDYIFAPNERDFEIDAYHEKSRVGIEINGGTWTVGGHSTGAGIRRDCQKILLAAVYGIQIIPITGDMLSQKEIAITIDQIWRVIKSS